MKSGRTDVQGCWSLVTGRGGQNNFPETNAEILERKLKPNATLHIAHYKIYHRPRRNEPKVNIVAEVYAKNVRNRTTSLVAAGNREFFRGKFDRRGRRERNARAAGAASGEHTDAVAAAPRRQQLVRCAAAPSPHGWQSVGR